MILSPLINGCMIAGKEYLRNFETAEFLRTRVVGIFAFAIKSHRKTFLHRRFIFAKHSGNLPRDGINQDHRRKFASCEHILPDRDLFVDVSAINDALIDSLISAAEEEEMRKLRELFYLLLSEAGAAGGKMNTVGF